METTFKPDAMAAEAVARIARVIDLAESSCVNSATNHQRIAEARAALADVAGIFDVDVPAANPVERN
ncbi:hypothetical protein [Devosia sp. 63-57]|uniref:hypothetical protein n=1 Tax=Devosia sp. 63-57 TaxID=1895751 RepID=UPI00086E40DE|nr:hypothetical protein [Devosia sp. 63-57]ODT50293.1 MAG: hypothetical protein ABS74_05080 [Pelagibacterium sp. SCN 63-126]ODU82756.1 MAG: hypothetical protein ABT14_16565 [Pelagibacterium sp. SCN 63-17]OJX45037.1 MAG: hypothetical protein BGO80_04080 [Devosia sp. 63-57]